RRGRSLSNDKTMSEECIRPRTLCCSFLLSAILAVPTSSKQAAPIPRQTDSAFAGIPAESREGFIERLDQVIERQRDHRWADLFDLLYDPSPNNKDAYVARNRKYFVRQRDGLLSFVPQETHRWEAVTLKEPTWVASGCAVFRHKGKVEARTSTVDAVIREGQWYFSPILIVGRCLPAESPDPCEVSRLATLK